MSAERKKSITGNLTEGPVGSTLLRFSVPFMIASLLQTVYNIVDAAVVGHFVGSEGLSAVSTCGEVIAVFTFLAFGFGAAGQTMIGQLIGAGDRKRINNTIGTLFTCLFGIALICTAAIFLTWRAELNLINLPEAALPDGRDYLLVCAAGMVFIFGYNLVSSILRGMGDSRHPLIFIAIASGANVVLDLLFVPGLGMGVFGAALATVMGQAISFLVSMIYLYRNREQFGFDFKLSSFRPKAVLLKTAFQLGIPMSAQGALVCISMLFVCARINAFGVAASAANGITLKLCSIVRIVASSMTTASSAMIAQCVGADRKDRIPQVVRWCLIISSISSAVCILGILVLPGQIFSFFNSDPEVLAFAAVYAIYGAIDYVGYALRAPLNSVANGIGSAFISMTAGLIDGVIARIAFSILFGDVLGMGVAGYWLGNALAGYTNLLVTGPYYFSGLWKKKHLNLGE